MFEIKKYYTDYTKIDTKDFLTALKFVSNFEGDLYYNHKLIYSSVNMDIEDKLESLLPHGITADLIDGTYEFRYIDKSKNKNIIYARFGLKKIDNISILQVKLTDYTTSKDAIAFKTIDEVIQQVKERFIDTGIVNVDNVNIFTFIGKGKNLNYLLKENKK